MWLQLLGCMVYYSVFKGNEQNNSLCVFSLVVKMISAEQSSNNGKNKVTKKPHSMVMF